jgi:hypothetical protein
MVVLRKVDVLGKERPGIKECQPQAESHEGIHTGSFQGQFGMCKFSQSASGRSSK